jgi:radical SAM protein with 4Fe4S-binding SPASM domain
MSNTPVMDRLVRKTVERRVPWNVHIDLTYRCNERCVHCYLDHQDYGEMTTREVKGVLDQLAEAGALFLTFSGGEIFLRKDLFELIAHGRALHFDIGLKTNALLIDVGTARRLRDLGVRKIQVSLYSAESEIHDAITKVPGSLERSLHAIRTLLDEGLQVKLACPLMKQNLGAFRGVQKLAEDLGVPYVFDLTITPKMDGDEGVLALRSSPTDLLKVLQDRNLNSRASAPEQAPADIKFITGSATSSGIESSAFDDLPCSAGHNSCYISPYGDLSPCVQMPKAAGNLRKQKFEEIWYGSREMNRVRAARESQLPLCSGCSIRQFCERCPGLAQMEGGDLLGAYERACELAEMNARLAGTENPVSALHAQRGQKSIARMKAPASELVQLAL